MQEIKPISVKQKKEEGTKSYESDMAAKSMEIRWRYFIRVKTGIHLYVHAAASAGCAFPVDQPPNL